MNVVATLRRRHLIGTSTTLQDITFLSVIVWLSLVLYVAGLGLYSDDWGFLSTLHRVSDPNFLSLFKALQAELSTRPLQAMLLAGLYRWFELDPLGYHVVNAVVLTIVGIMFYMTLRELDLPRMISVTVPLVFVLLPHYSTDRLWIAAFQANLSVGFYFFSLYASLRAIRSGGIAFWAWTISATVGVLGTVLAYEVVAPLFILSVSIVLYRTWQIRVADGESQRPSWKAPTLVGGLTLLVLGLSVAYKLTTTDRAGGLGGFGTYLWNIKRTVVGAVSTSYGSYGLALPQKVWLILTEHADTAMLAVGGLLGLLIFGYLYYVLGRTQHTVYGRRRWLAMVVVGVVAFGLGYAISLITFDIGFSATGINNRTAIAAAIGVAVSFVAGIGWMSSFVPRIDLRQGIFCALIAVLCTSGFLVINTIADYWVTAARRQQAVIASISRLQIPSESVLLLDGLCSYEGPGIVFETNWDVSGMLQIKFNRSLQGDVIKSTTDVRDDGVHTLLYDDVIHVYPFDENLFLYHLESRELYRLRTLDDATRYFEARDSTMGDPCATGSEGQGASIF